MKESFKQGKKVPYYAWLLPLFFVLHGYLEHFPVVSVTEAFLLYLQYLGATAVLVLLFYFILRAWKPAYQYSFLVMALQIFFGPVHDFLKGFLEGSFLVSYTFLIPFMAVCYLLLLLYFSRKKPVWTTAAQYLKWLFFTLIIIDLSLFTFQSRGTETVSKPDMINKCDSCQKPDVYLIIADAYAGKIALKDIMGFDNSPFEAQMRSRGFHIVDSTSGNYNFTPFTMASMLSMNYLKGLEKSNRSLNDRKICYNAIGENAVANFFTEQGYEIENYSVFKFSGKPPIQSTSYYPGGIDLIKTQTLLSRIDRDIRFNLVTRFKVQSEIKRITYHQKEINNTLFKSIWNEVNLSQSKSPKFYYVHLEMPHYPYYFKKDGKPFPIESLSIENVSNTDHYTQYLEYANKKYLDLIDHILKNSKRPPVILFMSDHGFREYDFAKYNNHYQYMNVNMVLLPNKNYAPFYSGMTTVNQFRTLLNAQFGQNLPLLKDTTIFIAE